MENKVFIQSLRKERGMVWRDGPALRGGGFKLSLGYNWIKKGGAIAVVWGVDLQFVTMLSSDCGCWARLVLFLLPVISSAGDKLRRVKRQSCLTRRQACSARCHNSKWGQLCPFNRYCDSFFLFVFQ